LPTCLLDPNSSCQECGVFHEILENGNKICWLGKLRDGNVYPLEFAEGLGTMISSSKPSMLSQHQKLALYELVKQAINAQRLCKGYNYLCTLCSTDKNIKKEPVKYELATHVNTVHIRAILPPCHVCHKNGFKSIKKRQNHMKHKHPEVS